MEQRIVIKIGKNEVKGQMKDTPPAKKIYNALPTIENLKKSCLVIK